MNTTKIIHQLQNGEHEKAFERLYRYFPKCAAKDIHPPVVEQSPSLNHHICNMYRTKNGA